MASSEFKKMMALKMKSQHRIRVPSKSLSRELFEARVSKKKMPDIPLPKNDKDLKYANMSIKQFEKKYG